MLCILFQRSTHTDTRRSEVCAGALSDVDDFMQCDNEYAYRDNDTYSVYQKCAVNFKIQGALSYLCEEISHFCTGQMIIFSQL